MKTQLLEDIGQSATFSFTSFETVGNAKSDRDVQNVAPAGNAEPAWLRSALGAWRQKPAGEPQISATQPPDQQPTPLESDSPLEEIAALKTQYVPPGRLHEPAIAPVESEHKFFTPPVEPPHEPATTPAGPALAPNPTQGPAAPQDFLFHFTPPPPARQVGDLFTRTPNRPAGSGRRYLLWGVCVLSGGLLIQGGRWLYQERNDARSLVLIADAMKEVPQVDNAVKRPAAAAQQLAPGLGGDVGVTPAVPASRPLSTLPPLVLLKPDPPAATKVEQPPASKAGRMEHQTRPKSERVEEQRPASPLPKPSARTARRQSDAAAERPTQSVGRKPVRQFARASAIGTERGSRRLTAKETTLRACKEHGYHAAQCIKMACSVTKYGFACRAP